MARMVLIMALTMETVLTGALILLIMDLLTPRRLLTMVTLPSPSLEVTLPLLFAPLAPAILTMETLLPLLTTETSLITTGPSMVTVVSALRIMRATPLHLLLTIPSLSSLES